MSEYKLPHLAKIYNDTCAKGEDLHIYGEVANDLTKEELIGFIAEVESYYKKIEREKHESFTHKLKLKIEEIRKLNQNFPTLQEPAGDFFERERWT